MIIMTQVERIKELKEKQGLSFREIARRTGIDRKTVSKWYGTRKIPQYTRKINKSPLREKVMPIISDWISEDLQLVKAKQKRRIRNSSCVWADLNRMGIRCGESTIRKIMRNLRPAEVFIPLEYDPGMDMQVDWGMIPVRFVGNKTLKVNLFVATLPFSNVRYVIPFIRADQKSFFEGHKLTFNFIGGIPGTITYDNLTSAIKKVLSGADRIEQTNMMKFRHLYNFNSNYCAIASGNEKGSVENGVGYVKRRYLGGSHEYKNFQELRDYLRQRCIEDMDAIHYKKRRKISDLFEEEKQHFLPLPDFDFDTDEIIKTKSDKTLFIKYDGVAYSIPSEYSEKEICIRVTEDKIIAYDSVMMTKEIVRHPRTHKELNKEIYDFRHYLPVLLEKSRALDKAVCIRRANFPPVFREYLKGLKSKQLNGNREMVRILLLHKKHNLEKIFSAMQWCHEHRSYSYDAVFLKIQESERSIPEKEEIKKSYPETSLQLPDLNRYDSLIGANV